MLINLLVVEQLYRDLQERLALAVHFFVAQTPGDFDLALFFTRTVLGRAEYRGRVVQVRRVLASTECGIVAKAAYIHAGGGKNVAI